MEASKWNLNEYSCVVEEKYTNIAEFIGLDLNKGLVYSEDSKALHQFADRGTNLRETWEVNYYAFLYLVERYLTQKPKPKRERQKKDFDGKKDKKKKKKKKNDGKANEVGNESDEAEEGEEEQEKEDEQEEEQPNKKIPSRGDLFLEAVPSQGYRNGGVKRITDYRYWFVVYKQADEPAAENGDEEKKKQRFKKKDENSIRFTWEKIVNECILYNQRLVSGKKRRYEPEVKHFEKWKAIKNAGHLASLLDSRTGCNFATAHQAQAEGLDVYEKTSPVCATSFFSGAWVPSATDVDADYRAMGKIDKYFTKEEGSDTYTLRFPLRKFVMKIPHSEISVVDLYNRMMPDYQETVYNQIVKMIPVIVKDESVMIDPSQVNVQDFYGQELGEDIRIAQQRKQDPSVNTLFDEKPAKKKKGRKTRLEKMREVAEKWELPIPIPEDASKLKTFDRAVAFQNTHALVSQLLKVPSAVYNYTTVYAPVALRALRNLGKIRQDYNARDRAKHWKDLKHPMSVARKLYLFNQQNVFREYESSCRNLEANLSPTAKKILQYAKKENLYADKRLPHDKYDKRMTPFCSLEAKRYMEWETAYLVNHNHKYMNLAAKYANDSVNMNFNRVHQHMLTHGPQGGEGKSYIWVVVANDIRIPDTTEFLTYETLRARATDETNMNDNVVIFDEVERSLVDKNSNNNDKERAIKMLLSSNKVSVKLLEIDDRGNRRTKVTVSESITVFFGSSNSNVHQLMSPAMKRRWHIADILEMVGVNRAIVDLQLAGLILSEEEKTYKAKLNREHHTLQTIIFDLEKLIHCKGLTDVSMHVAVVVIFYISHELERAGRPQPSPSMFDRVMTLARMNCILDAIETTFYTPGSEYYGKPIQIEHFKSLDRKLYCQAQHIVSALAEAGDLLINPTEATVKRAMKLYWEENIRKKDHGFHTEVHHHKSVNPETGEESEYRQSKYVEDYNYTRFPFGSNGLSHLAGQICNWIMKLKDPPAPMKYTPESVLSILDSWVSRQIKSHPYTEDPGRVAGTKALPVKDTSKPEATMYIGWKNDTAYFVHYGFLTQNGDLETPENFLGNIIKDIFSRKHQLPQLFPWFPDVNKPHIRNLLLVEGETPREKTGDAPLINLPSFVHMTPMAMEMLKGVMNFQNTMRSCEDFPIETDLDSWGFSMRNNLLYVDKIPIDPKSLVDNPMESLADKIRNKKLRAEEARLQREKEKEEEAATLARGGMDPLTYFLDGPADAESDERTSKSECFRREQEEGEPDLSLYIQRGKEEEEKMEEINLNAEEDEEKQEEESDKEEAEEEEEKKQESDKEEDAESDEDDDEKEEDEEYDMSTGYFLGNSLDKIFVDDVKGLESLDDAVIADVFKNLDDCDPASEDYDFNPEKFLVREEGGKKIYHWHLLGDFMEDVGVTFSSPDLDEMENMTEEERKKYEDAIEIANRMNYKMICYHPLIISMFEDAKCYEGRTFSRYPEDAISLAEETRQTRWAKASELYDNDENFRRKVEDSAKKNPALQQFISSHLTADGKLRRKSDHPLVMAENVLKKSRSEFLRSEKEYEQRRKNSLQQPKQPSSQQTDKKKPKPVQPSKYVDIAAPIVTDASSSEDESSSASEEEEQDLHKHKKMKKHKDHKPAPTPQANTLFEPLFELHF